MPLSKSFTLTRVSEKNRQGLPQLQGSPTPVGDLAESVQALFIYQPGLSRAFLGAEQCSLAVFKESVSPQDFI